jgi:hypothetical protein
MCSVYKISESLENSPPFLEQDFPISDSVNREITDVLISLYDR